MRLPTATTVSAARMSACSFSLFIRAILAASSAFSRASSGALKISLKYPAAASGEACPIERPDVPPDFFSSYDSPDQAKV